MSDPTVSLDCGEHGKSIAAFMCTHLANGIACGYHASDDDPSDRWPDAWCDFCERNRTRDEKTWEEAADIQLLCTGCHERARHRNERPPEPLSRGKLELGAKGWEKLVAVATDDTKRKQEEARRDFDLGTYARWNADYEAGWFTLGSQERAEVMADLQIVGSFSKKTDSWLWSWANEGNEPHLVREVSRLRVLGEVRSLERLKTEYRADVSEIDCWEMTSVACYLLGWDAVYRAPMDHRYLFFLLRNLRRAS
ncbi:MAG: DUF6882 domain-containing protein [Polyangiales bacterium]